MRTVRGAGRVGFQAFRRGTTCLNGHLHVTYIVGNIYVMRRTTVFLDDKLLLRAQRLAERQGVSFATVVREALSRYMAQPNPSPVPSVAGRFSGGRSDDSARVDELLWRDPHK